MPVGAKFPVNMLAGLAVSVEKTSSVTSWLCSAGYFCKDIMNGEGYALSSGSCSLSDL